MTVNICINFTASELIIHILNKRLTNEEQQIFYPTVPLTKITVDIISNIIDKLDSIKV